MSFFLEFDRQICLEITNNIHLSSPLSHWQSSENSSFCHGENHQFKFTNFLTIKKTSISREHFAWQTSALCYSNLELFVQCYMISIEREEKSLLSFHTFDPSTSI